MQKKYLALVIVILSICGLAVFEYSTSSIEGYLFDQIPYNYTGHVWIPPTSSDAGSISGYYNINGQGRDFNFKIMVPEQFDLHEINGTKIDLDENGLSGKGKLYTIQITPTTISALLSKDLKTAMFGTKLNGTYTMECAAWTGGGNFTNDGQKFSGTFYIIGLLTDWEGNFTLSQENSRIKILSSYIYYPHGDKSPGKIKKVENNTFFM
ncbi:hypothetical protein [Methanobacterium alcaliphilum]|uniref:hypothetical protein n=1 Tax=Methanobacterium alcaliphilum TaxID=392018 RepID=UPI00200A0EE9|nr:hypothetical protein [Methanobacterium alcaliphilum]MCK9152010.1 hypothetical protein [Methanobacterium alcaliphilum]